MTDPRRTLPMSAAMRPRDEHGRFVASLCTDPDCGGALVYDPTSPFDTKWFDWRCDGLTIAPNGELVACERTIESRP